MTRVLISMAVEWDGDERFLVTTWRPTEEEARAAYDAAGPLSPIHDPAFRLVKTEREPWSDLRVAELVAAYGDRPISLATNLSLAARPDLVALARLWAPEEAAARYLDFLDTLAPHTLVRVRPGLVFSVELLREATLEHRKGVRAALIEAGQ